MGLDSPSKGRALGKPSNKYVDNFTTGCPENGPQFDPGSWSGQDMPSD